MSILIIDDSQDELHFLDRVLRNSGYKDILLAGSARDGFRLLNESPGDIDLILMDIMMPEINGIDACHTIKKEDRFKDVPVVMVAVPTVLAQVALIVVDVALVSARFVQITVAVHPVTPQVFLVGADICALFGGIGLVAVLDVLAQFDAILV